MAGRAQIPLSYIVLAHRHIGVLISPIAENLTTTLIVCAVVMAVGIDKPKFITLACINIVVGANAGCALSPFGEIRTLMIWQKGIVDFATFFNLFVPSVVNSLVPVAIMHFCPAQRYAMRVE